MMDSRSASKMRPWLVDFFMTPQADQAQAQKLHICEYMSGPHEDGSIVKQGTDKDVFIDVRFTKNALESFVGDVGTQTADSHNEFSQACILIRKYRTKQIPEDRECPTYEIVVDDFSLWMTERGLNLKVKPLDCLEIQAIKERTDKLWAELSFQTCMEMESGTDVEELDGVDKDTTTSVNSSVKLTQLLKMLGEGSSLHVAEEVRSQSRHQSVSGTRSDHPPRRAARVRRNSRRGSSSRLQASQCRLAPDSPWSRVVEHAEKDASVLVAPTDLQLVRGGIFTEKMNLALLGPDVIPARLSATIDNTLLPNNADRQQQIKSISEWHFEYRPAIVPYSSTSTCISITHTRPPDTLTGTLTGAGQCVNTPLKATPGGPLVNVESAPWCDGIKRFHGRPSQISPTILGTMTVTDSPKWKGRREKCIATPACFVEFGDSFLKEVPSPSPSTKVHAERTDGLRLARESPLTICRLKSPSRVCRVLETMDKAPPNVASRTLVAPAPRIDSESPVVYGGVRRPDDKNVWRISNSDPLNETQGQRILSSGEKSMEPSENRTMKSSNSTCRVSREKQGIQRLSSDNEDDASDIGSVVNTLPLGDVGDYAQSINLSCSESPGVDRTCSRTPRRTESPAARLVGIESQFVSSLSDTNLARKPLHPHNFEVVINPPTPMGRRGVLANESPTESSPTVDNSHKIVGDMPNVAQLQYTPHVQGFSSGARSSKLTPEPRVTPRRGLRSASRQESPMCSGLGKVGESDTEVRGSPPLRNQCTAKPSGIKQCEDMLALRGSPRRVSRVVNSPAVHKIVGDHMNGVQLRHSPRAHRVSSSGSFSPLPSIEYSPLRLKCQHTEKLTDNEDIILPTPPKAKRMHCTSTVKANCDENVQLSNSERTPVTGAISTSMFYTNGKSEKKTPQTTVLTPKAKTKAALRMLPLDDSTNHSEAEPSSVLNSSLTCNDFSSVNPRDLRAGAADERSAPKTRTFSQMGTKCIGNDSQMTSADSAVTRMLRHSTQASRDDSAQSALLPLHLSPIYSNKHHSPYVMRLRVNSPSSPKGNQSVRCSRSPRINPSPNTLGLGASGQVAVSAESKLHAMQDADSASPVGPHKPQKASLRHPGDDDIERSDTSVLDIRKERSGKSSQLILENLDVRRSRGKLFDESARTPGFRTVKSSLRKTIGSSLDSSIQEIKRGSNRSDHTPGRNMSSFNSSRRRSSSDSISSITSSSSGLTSSSSLSSINTSTSISSNSGSPDSSIKYLSSHKHVGSPRQRVRSSPYKRRALRVAPQRISKRAVSVVNYNVPSVDTSSASGDSVTFIGQDEATLGNSEGNQSGAGESGGTKRVTRKKSRLHWASLQAIPKNQGTDQESGGQETKKDVRPASSAEKQIPVTPKRKLRHIKLRTKNSIVGSKGDTIEDGRKESRESRLKKVRSTPVRMLPHVTGKCKQVEMDKKINESTAQYIVDGCLLRSSMTTTPVLAQCDAMSPCSLPHRGKNRENKASASPRSRKASTGEVTDRETSQDSNEKCTDSIRHPSQRNKESLKCCKGTNKVEENAERMPPVDNVSPGLPKCRYRRSPGGVTKENNNEIKGNKRDLLSSCDTPWVTHTTVREGKGKTIKSKGSRLSRTCKTISLKEATGETENTEENSDSDFQPIPRHKKRTVPSTRTDETTIVEQDETSSEYDSEEEYLPSPKVRKMAQFLSAKATRRKTDRSRLSLREKAIGAFSTKVRPMKKKMNIKLTNAGKMEVVREPAASAVDVNMIFGAGAARKRPLASNGNNLFARKRKLYSDRTVLDIPEEDPRDDMMPLHLTNKSAKNALYGITGNTQGAPSKIDKVPLRITEMIGLLSSRAKPVLETPVSSLSLHQVVPSPGQNLIEPKEPSSSETSANSVDQAPPPSREDDLDGGLRCSLRTPVNSLPSHQPQPAVPAFTMTDSSLERASPQTVKMVCLTTPVNSLPSHQGAPQQPASRSDAVKFHMDDVMAIIAALPGSECKVLMAVNFPRALIAPIRDYFSNNHFAYS